MKRRGSGRESRLVALLLSGLLAAASVPARAATVPTIRFQKAVITVLEAHKADTLSCDSNPANGNKSLTSPGGGYLPGSPALAIAPRHNAQNPRDSVWGRGWHTDLDQVLTLQPDGAIVWTGEDGAQATFFDRARATSAPKPYAAPVNTYESLTATSLDASGAPAELALRFKDGTVIAFTRFGQTPDFLPVRLTDRNGNANSYARDAFGRLSSAVDVHGRTLLFSYNAAGKVASIDDGAGRTITYSYDAAGDKTGEDTHEGTLLYAYDAAHRITQITYPNGGKRTFLYDAQGRIAEEFDDLAANRRAYEYFGSSTVVADSLGRITVYDLTGKQGLKKVGRVVDPAGNATALDYDLNLNLARQAAPGGRVTAFSYDGRGNVVETVDPVGGRTLLAYEPSFNQATSVTDPRGKTTAMSYDAQGNLAEVRDALGSVTRMGYDAIGHVSSTQDPLGKTTSFSYDPRSGALTAVTDPLARTTQMVRDALGRVTRNTDAAGKQTLFEYDAAGNLTQVTDALGGVTRYAYAAGRDGGKLLAGVTDAKGNATSFGYDVLGRLASVTNPLGQTKSFVYDGEGNLTQVTDAKGQIIRFGYDSLDRLTAKTLPEGGVAYEYDAVGNLTKVTNHNGSVVAMTYDPLDRVIQTAQTLPNGFTATIGYAYDANGNRTSMTTPWGAFSYAYDELNRLTRITNPDNRTFAFQYDALGRRTRLIYPNGIETSYAYDDASQLLEIKHTRASDSAVVALAQYTYDQAGNRTSMTDLAGMHAYGYDDLHRLTSASHPPASILPVKNETFGYDAVGNRLADAELAGYQYDGANRLLENSSFTYTYDTNGNQTSKTGKQGQGTTAYAYDSENQLTRVDLPDGTVSAYMYDALGRRIEKSTGTVPSPTVRRYVYDNEDILAMLNGQNALVALFTHGVKIDDPLSFKDGAAEFDFHKDGSDTPTSVTNGMGDFAEQYEFSAYGIRHAGIGDAGGNQSGARNPFFFAGRERDAETGLQYHRFRFYEPSSGRFLQEEELGFDGPNRYWYALASPTRFRDPTGLAAEGALIGGISGALLGGYIGGIGGTIVGGSIGTLALPGGGTLAGGFIGINVGVVQGSILGSVVGTFVGSILQDTMSFAGESSSDPEVRDAKDDEVKRRSRNRRDPKWEAFKKEAKRRGLRRSSLRRTGKHKKPECGG